MVGNESWLGIGGEAVPDLENGTVGDGFDPPQTTTLEPWYTSGQNAEFTTINGAYSPVIAMTVRTPSLNPQMLACLCKPSATTNPGELTSTAREGKRSGPLWGLHPSIVIQACQRTA